MSGTTQAQRRRQRIAVNIPVTVTTVLDSQDAFIADLTEFGAMIVGASCPKGTLFQLDYDGHSVYGRVMWEEIDRMGVRFPFDLREGPLYDLLKKARGSRPAVSEFVAVHQRPATPPMLPNAPVASFGRAGMGGPARFGRRM